MYWTSDRKPRQAPEDWQTARLTPHFEIKALWFAARDFGVVIDLSNLMVEEAVVYCPF